MSLGRVSALRMTANPQEEEQQEGPAHPIPGDQVIVATSR
jgi:hypothetical protein